MASLGGSSDYGFALGALQSLKNSKNPPKNWKWVGGSRSHLDKKKLENRPKRKFA